MRSFLAAMAISCAVGGMGYAGYSAPSAPLPDLSDLAEVAQPAPVVLAALTPPGQIVIEDKTFTTDGIPLPKPRATIKKPSLLALAQAHIGHNPTGWAHVWCARFVALIAPELARKVPNPNLARAWTVLPKAERKPGAIVVLTRRGGGHIGIVKGFTRRGDPIVISGNARGRSGHRVVAEAVYPKSRVIAYVGG